MTPTTARLFPCERTPAEIAATRRRNAAGQGSMFDVAADRPAACPACGGVDDCSCGETGAEAMTLTEARP